MVIEWREDGTVSEIHGFMIFRPSWTWGTEQFECPGTFTKDGGHYLIYETVDACYIPPSWIGRPDQQWHVCEVIGRGNIEHGAIYGQWCVTELEIVREIDKTEISRSINLGNYNSGRHNIGFSNSGYGNVGTSNTGNSNVGSCNSGSCNSGNHNVGDYNAGDMNLGDLNIGEKNYGLGNHGNRNYGCGNIGDSNLGSRNIGYGNSGRNNIGNGNSGTGNIGYGNVGDLNIGDYNASKCSYGCFNTAPGEFRLFNKPTDWTMDTWTNSEAYRVMATMPKAGTSWIFPGSMSAAQKRKYSEYKVLRGYLRKDKVGNVTRQHWWDHLLSDEERQAVLSIPNFDPKIFKKCTGIDARKESTDDRNN